MCICFCMCLCVSLNGHLNVLLAECKHGLVAFLSLLTPCSRQLVRLGVRRSCAPSHESLLLLFLSLSLCFSLHPVWRLRNDTRQVTVVTLWGIGCCQPLCKPAWAWRSSPQCPQRLQTQAWPWKTNLYQKKDGSPLPAQREEWRTRGVHTVYLYCVLFIEDVGEW